MKQIAKQCGIKTRLTYHVSRHPFGTLLTTSQGVPIETVSRMMGYTNIKTTQIYAKITKEKISQGMEILSQKLEGLEKQITERIYIETKQAKVCFVYFSNSPYFIIIDTTSKISELLSVIIYVFLISLLLSIQFFTCPL